MALEGRRVLFVSYNGMLDPLGQSQVIPYLRELADNEGVRFHILSFERPHAYTDEGRARADALREQLRAHRIDWHALPYHQTPSLPATAYDVWAGTRRAKRLTREKRIELVHARGYIPAAIALALKKSLGVKMIFDVRGLMAEEYADAGHWREGDFKYRLTKRMERRFFERADGVVTLTESIWPVIREWEGLRGRDVPHEVIPCCADLERFRFDAEARARVRAELGVGDERLVLVYSGGIDGWYMTEEMADFFDALRRARADAHFLWLTTGSRERVESLMRERGVGRESFTVQSVESSEVASYLSASDAGVAFIKPCFSKRASSPTKTAEYLACGLPVVLNAGVGDSDALITREHLGALVRSFTEEEYVEAAARIFEMTADAEATRRRARDAAERFFDVRRTGLERYARLYGKVWSLESQSLESKTEEIDSDSDSKTPDSETPDSC